MNLTALPKFAISPALGGFKYDDMVVFATRIKEYQLKRTVFKKKQIFYNIIMMDDNYNNYAILDPLMMANNQSQGRALRRGR